MALSTLSEIVICEREGAGSAVERKRYPAICGR
jgi:hypothetical protein